MKLKFTNADITKIVKAVHGGTKWEYSAKSDNGKLNWVLKNNKAKNKIDLWVNGKFIDDWKYDKEEKDDVYATVVNVLDYLTDVVAKYNRANKAAKVVKEVVDVQEQLSKNNSKFNVAASAEELKEAMSKGMLKAYSKRVTDDDTHYCCKDCGQKIPKYKGRYGKNCPNCGGNIVQMKEKDHEIAITAAYQRGSTVSVKLPSEDDFWTTKGRILGFTHDTNKYSVEVTDGPDKGNILHDISANQIRDI